MKPFDPNVTCPKCGCGEIGSTYRENVERKVAQYEKYRDHFAKTPPQTFSEQRYLLWVEDVEGWLKRNPPPYTEHLARTCKVCGYSWPESPLDAVKVE